MGTAVIYKKFVAKPNAQAWIDWCEASIGVMGFDATLHLVTVNTPNDFKSTGVAQETMDNFLKGFNVKKVVTHIYNESNVEKGILNFASSINADLIGMSTHGRKGLSHFFNGSISEDLVNHAKRPVVTFKI